MEADLNYSADGMFTQFFANTPAGERAWIVIASVSGGTGKIYTTHLASTLRQLRDAGYSVHKAKPVKFDADEADALLAALAA